MLAEQAKQSVLDYHVRTKHHPDRYARSPGYLDWETQPYPWREFDGTRRIDLPLAVAGELTPFNTLFSNRPAKARPLTLSNIGLFLELSLGLTAWKQSGPSRWALRANPSSGNLHPTEGYLFLPPMDGLGVLAALYHYVSQDHFLEERCRWPSTGGCDPNSFFMALTSITWREEWKYGERAFRYCQHDTGHALAAIRIAAACLGWRMRLLWNWNEEDLSHWLGVDRAEDYTGAERETPECFFQVWAEGEPGPDAWTREDGQWHGKANRLSAGHADWPAIDVVKEASRHVASSDFNDNQTSQAASPPLFPAVAHAMENVIRQRRSAVAFDGETPMALSDFLGLLDLTLPRAGTPPFDIGAFNRPEANLILFVHRVTGLEPGVYAWVRGDLTEFKNALHPEFRWSPIGDNAPLYLLAPADTQDLPAPSPAIRT